MVSIGPYQEHCVNPLSSIVQLMQNLLFCREIFDCFEVDQRICRTIVPGKSKSKKIGVVLCERLASAFPVDERSFCLPFIVRLDDGLSEFLSLQCNDDRPNDVDPNRIEHH